MTRVIVVNSVFFLAFKDGALQDSELNELFSTAPESPWDEAPYKNSVERTESGDIRLSAFLSQVRVITSYLYYKGMQ
ncbi:hypothetical protein Hanom_Chr00s000002g01600721 [Helianthus anomalus]